MGKNRFFNYSEKVPGDFKDILESTLITMDRSKDTITYTPFVSVFTMAIVAALQAALTTGCSISPYFSLTQLILSAGTALTLGISKAVNISYQAQAANLITEGVHEGFFKSERAQPNIPAEQKDHDEIMMLRKIDATKLRLLHPS